MPRSAAAGAVALALLLLVSGLVAAQPTHASARASSAPRAGGFALQTFSFSPSTISQGSSTQGTIQLSGGTTPYYAWLNNTPPGCQPPMSPYVTSNATNTFNCNPSGTGSFTVRLDVSDSSHPANRQSQSAMLTVNGNGGGNGSGSGKNSSGGGFSLPGGLLSLFTIFALVFLAAMVALAAGVIAIAVMVSRRLRQLNETLVSQQKPPSPGKPPP